jgi:glutathione S-transferase
MKLYYAPGACSLAPMILAEWLDLPLGLEKVNNKQPSSEYLRKNPLGAVPALELDSGAVRNQVDAILQYFLALRPDSGLDAGDNIDDAFELHRWIAFLTGDYHPPWGAWFNPGRFTSDHSDESLAAVKRAVAERIAKVSRLLEEQVSEDGHIALGRRTVLDAYAFSMVRWTRNLDGGFDPYPKLDHFIRTMKADDGVQRALHRERS